MSRIFSLSLSFVVILNIGSQVFCQSSRWVYIAENKHSTIFYDNKTIKISGNEITAFTKMVYTHPDYNEHARKYVEYMICKDVYYCTERKLRYLSITQYFTDGTQSSHSYDESDDEELIDIIPDTGNEKRFDVICGLRAKTK